MYVIIMGCGRVGARLANLLEAAGHEVTILDLSAQAFERLGPDFRGSKIIGDGKDAEVLRRAPASGGPDDTTAHCVRRRILPLRTSESWTEAHVDFGWSSEELAFRDRVREFIHSNWHGADAEEMGEDEDEVVFELVGAGGTDRVPAYHFVLSHGYDAAASPSPGRAVH